MEPRALFDWTMWSWEAGYDGKLESGVHEYGDEDILGQAAMTEAMFDWLEDEGAVHPLCLDAAMPDFAVDARHLRQRAVSAGCDVACQSPCPISSQFHAPQIA